MSDSQSESSKERLKVLLRELFQFDSADLDFGIYRIMNQRRDEIEKFIEKDLIARTEEAFKEYVGTSTESLQKELKELKDKINKDFGAGTIDELGEAKKNTDAPKVLEYLRKKEELKNAELSQGQIDDVYNQVYEFFSRYYDNGDIVSKRRQGGKEKYVIPYKGEEVIFHWANKDQYYVKTKENFSNYEFKADGWTIRFVIVKAEEWQNNAKGAIRFFILSDDIPPVINLEKQVLTISFEYRGLTDIEDEKLSNKDRQGQLAEEALEKILSEVDGNPIKDIISKPERVGNKTIKLIEKHLSVYVKKNSCDYFIHKNLEGFLSNELDFFLKNEVLQLDELIAVNENAVKLNIARVKAIRDIGFLIIHFLAQIENFQKMLFEKKKFVNQTEYCITIDKIPNIFYQDIAKNKEQVAEWKRLFQLDKITEGTLFPTQGKETLDVAFLESHPHLVLDTIYFNNKFKDKILNNFDNLDETIQGVIIKSENLQALNLLYEKYKGLINCIYIDPPYNTGNDGFIYKDNYQHSSWLSNAWDRVSLSTELLCESGIFLSSIDDNEMDNYSCLLKSIFDENNFIGVIPTIMNLKGNQDEFAFAGTHEYTMVASKNKKYAKFYELNIDDEEVDNWEEDQYGLYKKGANLKATGVNAPRDKRPNLFFPVYISEDNKITIDRVNDSDIELLPKTNGLDMSWRWSKNKFISDSNDIIISRSEEEISLYKKQRPKMGDTPSKKPKSVFYSPRYSSGNGTAQLLHLFGDKVFSNPKPIDLIVDLLQVASAPNDLILDYYAGSGTTGHAVLKMNAMEGDRKFILVDFGEHLINVTLPRIKKVAYCSDWEDGQPIIGATGQSIIIKYSFIEQYEDSLNNIVLPSNDNTIQETLDSYDDYLLRYILRNETRESKSIFSLDDFNNPFQYKIKTVTGGKEQIVSVDLVETFNYLLGLHVQHILTNYDGDRYYKTVQGKRCDDRSVIIIWRATEGIDLKRDKEFIEREFLKEGKPDIIYVNGMCHVDGALPIEPDFKKLMGA